MVLCGGRGYKHFAPTELPRAVGRAAALAVHRRRLAVAVCGRAVPRRHLAARIHPATAYQLGLSTHPARHERSSFLPAQGTVAQSRRDGMFIANVAPNIAKLRRSGMFEGHVAPTELGDGFVRRAWL